MGYPLVQKETLCNFPLSVKLQRVSISQGIYFAAKSGRMAAEAIVEGSKNGTHMVDESDLRVYLDKWDRKYWATYKVSAHH